MTMWEDAGDFPAPKASQPAWDSRQIAALRGQHGWTQEQLAERSGLSVRTIRNLELGRVRNPRRSSIDLLAHVLGMEHEPDSGAAAVLNGVQWRGPQPPGPALVGDGSDHEQLAHTVRANRLTTLYGPGGVGKTALALSVAAEAGRAFQHGVVVVELGDLAPERYTQGSQADAILHRVARQIGRGPLTGRPGARPEQDARQMNLLLVLDNAEHVPGVVVAAVRELLATFPLMRILITARRRLTERLGVNREIRPLPFEADHGEALVRVPAVELVLRHVGADSPAAADLAKDLPLVAELCRRLGGLPRYLEFAAERLRMVPIRMLLACGPTMEMLWSNDHALLRHQRSVADGIRWNMDLLTGEHRRLLGQIAALPAPWFTPGDAAREHDLAGRSASVNPLALLSDLLETSLIVADPGDPYRYRLAPYVGDVIERDLASRVRLDLGQHDSVAGS
jgi:predicted ATPase/transcriptional regulator with XRE-family HTH domain